MAAPIDTALAVLREDRPDEAAAVLVRLLEESGEDAKALELLELASRCAEHPIPIPLTKRRKSPPFNVVEMDWFDEGEEVFDDEEPPPARGWIWALAAGAVACAAVALWALTHDGAPRAPASTVETRSAAVIAPTLATTVPSAQAKPPPKLQKRSPR